jgi:hypothetical protein
MRCSHSTAPPCSCLHRLGTVHTACESAQTDAPALATKKLIKVDQPEPFDSFSIQFTAKLEI